MKKCICLVLVAIGLTVSWTVKVALKQCKKRVSDWYFCRNDSGQHLPIYLVTIPQGENAYLLTTSSTSLVREKKTENNPPVNAFFPN